MIILRYHEIFFRLTAPRCTGMAAGAVSLRTSHDIVILSFCNIVKGQAIYIVQEIFFDILPNKVGHLLLELGFNPHSTPRFRDLTNKFTKQNSIAEFDRKFRLVFRQ